MINRDRRALLPKPQQPCPRAWQGSRSRARRAPAYQFAGPMHPAAASLARPRHASLIFVTRAIWTCTTCGTQRVGLRVPTFAMHVRAQIKLRDEIGWSRLDPDALPDARARRVEDVRRMERLLADRYHRVARVGGIVHEDQSAMSAGANVLPLALSLTIRWVRG